MKKLNYIKYTDINYVMPFMFTNDLWILILKELLKEEVNPVKHIYGSVYCAWQSGRHAKVFTKKLPVIERYLQNVSELGLIPDFTFSTINVDNAKLNDEFSNQLLDLAYKYNSYFIVSSGLLYKHIKKRYNNAKMVCSVISPIVMREEPDFNETDFYNRMLDKYEIVVIRPEYIMENIDKLDKLIKDISRIEVLVNQTCFYNCPHHRKHYLLQEKTDLIMSSAGRKNYKQLIAEEKTNTFCPRYNVPKENYISVRMNTNQMERLVQSGVKFFKLHGREGSVEKFINDMYEFMFNPKISKEELKNKLDVITSDIVLNNRALQYLQLLNAVSD